MSRIGKKPVAIPGGVKVEVSGNQVTAKGPAGELLLAVHPLMMAHADHEDNRRRHCRQDSP